jgi:hypothetical protein
MGERSATSALPFRSLSVGGNRIYRVSGSERSALGGERECNAIEYRGPPAGGRGTETYYEIFCPFSLSKSL